MGLGLTYQDEEFHKQQQYEPGCGHTRIDAAVYYEWSDDLRIQLNVENLGDTDYYPSSHGTHRATVGAPFQCSP